MADSGNAAASAAPAPPVAKADRWAVLKRAISSPQRLELFAKVPQRELGIFVKAKEAVPGGFKGEDSGEGTEARERPLAGANVADAERDGAVEAGERVTYCGWSDVMPARPKAGAFAAVEIVKPAMTVDRAPAAPEAVDATGLLRLYPSEEVLAAYMLVEAERFRGKAVIEIGAGFCGLAGLIFAKNAPFEAPDVCLSDGSHEVLRLVEQHIAANGLQGRVRSKFLMWDRTSDYAGEEERFGFDFVVLSDCLYLGSIHLDLLNAIYHLLKEEEGATCIIISPPRYKSMDAFLAKAAASGRFSVSKSQGKLAPLIAPLHCEPFAPYLIELTRTRSPSCEEPPAASAAPHVQYN